MIPSHTMLAGKSAGASGIIQKFDSSDRIVPESRRPDGTVRKERKIRPGFTPAEDAQKFRSGRQAEADLRKPPLGSVVGYTKPGNAAAIALANASLSQASKKNAKRKEKRKESAAGSLAGAPASDVPEDWDLDTPPEPEEKEVDPQKRAKALQKKIRQAEALKEKQDQGDKLLPEQSEKVASLAVLTSELEALSLELETEPLSRRRSAAVQDVIEDPSELDTPNSAALPPHIGVPLNGPLKVSHPLTKPGGGRDEIPDGPTEQDAHLNTPYSGRALKVPTSAA